MHGAGAVCVGYDLNLRNKDVNLRLELGWESYTNIVDFALAICFHSSLSRIVRERFFFLIVMKDFICFVNLFFQ